MQTDLAAIISKVRLALSHEVRTLPLWISAVYASTLVVLLLLVVVNLQTGIAISFLTRDPAAAMKAPFYVGMVSNIGVILWCSAAAICLFSHVVVREKPDKREWSLFFLFAGLITAWLLFDDFFMFHEEVFPKYLHISQKLVFAGYGALVLFFLVRFSATILNSSPLFLCAALGFFGLSIFVDTVIQVRDFHLEFIAAGFLGRHLLEDGFKLFGIASWSTYFIRVCAQQLRQELAL